jgi:3-oxoacyl-[acyl-carrier-protein] synthase I
MSSAPLGIPAMGIVTPIGNGKDAVARALSSGMRGLTRRDDLALGRSVFVGAVTAALPKVPHHLTAFDCRNNRLLLLALGEIRAAVDAAAERFGRDRIAVILGTSTAGIAEADAAYAILKRTGAWPVGFGYPQQETGNLAAFAARALGLTGPAYTVATACSSSGKVFGAAQRLIRAGLCDAAIVGGADTLCKMTLNGFAVLDALSPGLCNPFSRNRDGINIGEAAAVFLLTREIAPVQLLGVGESSDAHHMSAPDPDGAGAHAAMAAALQDAALGPAEIDYVNLHGTATPLNDEMEAKAMDRLFGARMPCSATKAMTGHTLGAAGACEAGFLWLTLHPEHSAGVLPPHLWDGARDTTLPALDLVEAGRKLPTARALRMLSSSFAFGGSNVAVILGQAA